MGRPVVAFAGDTSSRAVRPPSFARPVSTGSSRPTRGRWCALASELAADPLRLGRIAAGLRERLLASPVCDADAFTRRLENAYREAWRRWC